jgi:AI-2 transport protein TqsA
MEQAAMTSDENPGAEKRQPWRNIRLSSPVVGVMVIAAAGWYLLKELAPLLRPLCLAALLGYVLLPTYRRIKQRFPGMSAFVVMVVVSVGCIYLLSLLIYASILELNEELPRFLERGQEFAARLQSYTHERLPWLAQFTDDVTIAEEGELGRLQAAGVALVNYAAVALMDAFVVGIYLIFLLLEARRFPERIRSGFSSARADQILVVIGNINEAMSSYLRVKVKASLLLAVPVTLVLLVFKVKFALMWGVLTFLFNFIPYLGSIAAYLLPVLLAFLDKGLGWQPVAVAVLLLALHTASASLIEPAMIGRAVGLSPLVILAALTFWSLCWGLTGMLLAVPLTVMLKIVLENVNETRPFARLMGDDAGPVNVPVPPSEKQRS